MDAALHYRDVLGRTAVAVAEVSDAAFCSWRRALVQRVGRYALFVDRLKFRVDSANLEVRTEWTGQGRWRSISSGGESYIESGGTRFGVHFPYQLPETGEISLIVYNLLGQRVRVLAEGNRQAGYYQVAWDGRDDSGREVSSGVYCSRLVVNGSEFTAVRKMVLLK